VDSFFPTTGGGANGTVNALAVVPAAPFDQIFAGGEFSFFNQVARLRVAKFTSSGLDLAFDPDTNFLGTIPNPVRALVLTNGAFTAAPPFTILHVGGQQTGPAPGGSASVGLAVTNGTGAASLTTLSSFFPANPAVVRAMAANLTTGALFGGEFLNSRAEKLVSTFNSAYNPPTAGGLPSFIALGPTQFYASALLPNGDLLIGGDVGIPAVDGASPDGGHVAELYRITACGVVTTVARFQNVAGYLVRNDVDDGTFVSPPQDINTGGPLWLPAD
jgi:hypothetical protein